MAASCYGHTGLFAALNTRRCRRARRSSRRELPCSESGRCSQPRRRRVPSRPKHEQSRHTRDCQHPAGRRWRGGLLLFLSLSWDDSKHFRLFKVLRYKSSGRSSGVLSEERASVKPGGRYAHSYSSSMHAHGMVLGEGWTRSWMNAKGITRNGHAHGRKGQKRRNEPWRGSR